MNYYIDFDNTLYDTGILIDRMLNVIANEICKNLKYEKDVILLECKSMFNRENIYDIYELAKYFSDKYGLDFFDVKNKINACIGNSSDLVYSDVKAFLENLKANENKLYLLTFSTGSLEYQSLKVEKSGIVKYFDDIIITTTPKYELKNINYKEGIFIDDNPDNLIGLVNAGGKVIRISRPGNKYSKVKIDGMDIEEHYSFVEMVDF